MYESLNKIDDWLRALQNLQILTLDQFQTGIEKKTVIGEKLLNEQPFEFLVDDMKSWIWEQLNNVSTVYQLQWGKQQKSLPEKSIMDLEMDSAFLEFRTMLIKKYQKELKKNLKAAKDNQLKEKIEQLLSSLELAKKSKDALPTWREIHETAPKRSILIEPPTTAIQLSPSKSLADRINNLFQSALEITFPNFDRSRPQDRLRKWEALFNDKKKELQQLQKELNNQSNDFSLQLDKQETLMSNLLSIESQTNQLIGEMNSLRKRTERYLRFRNKSELLVNEANITVKNFKTHLHNFCLYFLRLYSLSDADPLYPLLRECYELIEDIRYHFSETESFPNGELDALLDALLKHVGFKTVFFVNEGVVRLTNDDINTAIFELTHQLSNQFSSLYDQQVIFKFVTNKLKKFPIVTIAKIFDLNATNLALQIPTQHQKIDTFLSALFTQITAAIEKTRTVTMPKEFTEPLCALYKQCETLSASYHQFCTDYSKQSQKIQLFKNIILRFDELSSLTDRHNQGLNLILKQLTDINKALISAQQKIKGELDKQSIVQKEKELHAQWQEQVEKAVLEAKQLIENINHGLNPEGEFYQYYDAAKTTLRSRYGNLKEHYDLLPKVAHDHKREWYNDFTIRLKNFQDAFKELGYRAVDVKEIERRMHSNAYQCSLKILTVIQNKTQQIYRQKNNLNNQELNDLITLMNKPSGPQKLILNQIDPRLTKLLDMSHEFKRINKAYTALPLKQACNDAAHQAQLLNAVNKFLRHSDMEYLSEGDRAYWVQWLRIHVLKPLQKVITDCSLGCQHFFFKLPRQYFHAYHLTPLASPVEEELVELGNEAFISLSQSCR